MHRVAFLFLLLLFSSCEEQKDPPAEKPYSQKKEKPEDQPLLQYKIISERKPITLTDDSLKREVDRWLAASHEFSIDSLTDFLLDVSEEKLTFTFDKCTSDPNKLLKHPKANCVGYAAFFNSLMNYALKKKKLTHKFSCRHYVGKIYFDGNNVNTWFNDPFFRDHDFAVIHDLKTGEDIAVDPSLFDYLGVRRVQLRK